MADKSWALTQAIKITTAYAGSGNAVTTIERILEALYKKLIDLEEDSKKGD